MPSSEFIPLRLLIPWPRDIYPPLEDDSGLSFLDLVGVQSFRLDNVTGGLRLSLDLAAVGEARIGVTGIEQLEVVLGSAGATTTITATLSIGQTVALSVEDISLRLRFPPFLLKAMRREGERFVERRDEDGRLAPFEIKLEGADLVIREGGNIEIGFQSGSGGVSLGPFMVGDTGVVVEASDVQIYLSEGVDPPSGVTSATKGIYISSALIHLPESLAGILPDDVVLENFFIGSGGFSGEVRGNWSPALRADGAGFEGTGSGELLGIPFGLRQVALEFQHNTVTSSDIRGSLLVPYFGEAVEVRINLLPDARFTVTLQGGDASGITLTKEELLALNIKSLGVTKDENNVGSIVVSGGLEPLLMSSDGLKWPRLDVNDLYIDSTGRFRIREAWLDLKELATLDLWGFHLELSRVGVGYEEGRASPQDDRLWVDLSGSLRLIEQIPVGLGVEGFRLKWPLTLFDVLGIQASPTVDQVIQIASHIEVQFDGIYLFFGVPEAVEFEGLIRFFKDAQVVGFAGDMALRVPASGLGVEAGLLVGMNFEAPPYPFLYVYFGVDLPAGIPLGQSGLALKGAQGLFGLNVAPDKAPQENWYYDWYKRGPIVGAHPTNKWKPERNALALGVGVTITTADGYLKGTRGLLVLSIPGPILIIEGRALILSGLQPNAEPPLRALAVFDGVAKTVQFNVEAEATLVEDMLEAYGMLEAFFDFNDPTNWHLYLGMDEPRDRRVRASLIKLNGGFLFKADAYLMLDTVGGGTLRSRMGVFVGFEPEIPDIGPLKVEFYATVEGDGVVTARPEQFSGDVNMSAIIRLSAFDVGVKLAADADVLTEGPDPLKVGANVHIQADLPWPLDPVDATVEFTWQSPPTPTIESPLSEIIVNSRFAPSGGGFRSDVDGSPYSIHQVPISESSGEPDFTSLRSRWRSLAEDSPVVPADSQPIIAFGQEMNASIDSFARHPDGRVKHYDLGLVRFKPELTAVKLYEHRKETDDAWNGDDSDWKLIASSDPDDDKPLPGVWLVESDPASPAAPSPRRAQLWTDNPLSHAGRALGSGYSQFLGVTSTGNSLPRRLLEDYPDLMKCGRTKAQTTCVNFRGAAGVVIGPGDVWEHEELRFGGAFRPARIRTDQGRGTRWPILGRLRNWLFPRRATRACLYVDGYLDIHFPRRVRKVWLKLCRPSRLSKAQIRSRLEVKRASRTLAELAALRDGARRSGAAPDLRACIADVPADLTISRREWVVEAEEGFDCLSILRMDEFAVGEICYVTEDELERARRAKRQCRTNTSLPVGGQTLRPGGYYRLDVDTQVAGELRVEDLPFASSSLLGEMLVDAYEGVMRELGFSDDAPPRKFHQAVFFQTDGPPSNLRPYIKWSSPQHQADRFFYEDDLAIRFLRGNVREMFDEPFGLSIQIRDAQGKLVGRYKTEWALARSATLFVEESVWEEHRRSLGWAPAPAPRDDLLLARLIPGPGGKGLLPSARYEVQIVRDDDQVEPGKDRVLFSSTFTTSAFASFKALVSSYKGRAVSLAANNQYQSSLSLIGEVRRSARVWARAEWDWGRAQVDHRFETLAGGREGLERARLARRQARAAHDAKYRALADGLANLYYEPLSESLEIYLIKDSGTGATVCAWIRSPESLDLRMAVVERPEDELSSQIDYVGRTEVRLQNRGSSVPNYRTVILHNADNTQLLIFPEQGSSWAAGPHVLSFIYHRDYGDEVSQVDHRYDRPVVYSRGGTGSEEQTVEWIL